jgi:hypothetical protein
MARLISISLLSTVEAICKYAKERIEKISGYRLLVT